ncbi:MAG: proline--tRNA ligase [Nitrososphaerales archaeon]
MSKEIGITVKKVEDFSEWYNQVVLKAELADYASAKGFMVLRPYGYQIWEIIQSVLDCEFKKLGHRNAYFPALIPESILKREAEHFKGFVPEVFWVTEAGDNRLGERLAVRPTSETIAYSSYSKWIRSWRDLPLLLNFWNSVMRAEIKSTKPFLRTSEFLWQEGHTAHATKEEADEETMKILNLYKWFIEEYLAIPVLAGCKTEREKFVGALYTTTLEAIMPDGKALQMGTSHNLGQNFSKVFEIKYLGQDKQEHYVWQTSWGVSWRLIGAVIMVHGDDKGLILPPKIAPIQVVVIPIFYKDKPNEKLASKAKEITTTLQQNGIRAFCDDREEYTPGWKFNDWELKGVPLRLEIGPRDLEKHTVTFALRDTGKRVEVDESSAAERAKALLEELQKRLKARAESMLKELSSTADSYDEFKRILSTKGGFIKAGWCGDQACEASIKEDTGADIRVVPFEGDPSIHRCVYCGKEAKITAYFARAY